MNRLSFEQLDKLAKETLPEKRYRHTVGVVEAAEMLAEKYGADPEKAKIAGYLHDITKAYTAEQQYAFCAEYGIKLDEIEQNSPKLLHALTGAKYAEAVLGIEDREILDALRCHTTGRRDMSKMDKILYLADYIEVNRDFPGVETIRALIDEGLDAMMRAALIQTVMEVAQKGVPIHPNTIACYNQLMTEALYGKR